MSESEQYETLIKLWNCVKEIVENAWSTITNYCEENDISVDKLKQLIKETEKSKNENQHIQAIAST